MSFYVTDAFTFTYKQINVSIHTRTHTHAAPCCSFFSLISAHFDRLCTHDVQANYATIFSFKVKTYMYRFHIIYFGFIELAF